MILSVAVSVAVEHIQFLAFRKMHNVVDMFNVMAYDFVSGTIGITAHSSNLYPTKFHQFSGHTGVMNYISRGIPPRKINLGIPLYGKVCPNTNSLGSRFSGNPPPDLVTEPTNQVLGPVLKRKLQAEVPILDRTEGASYVIDSKDNFVISYDNRDTVDAKAAYIKRKGLGGAMFFSTYDDVQGLIAFWAETIRSTAGAQYG